MTALTDRDVVEKWSHIAMKLFPPQMAISVATASGGWDVRARWQAAADGAAPLTRGARGVDLHFDERSIAGYLGAGVDAQLKCDLYIESAISDRLQSFDPLERVGAQEPAEKWEISLGDCVTT